MGQGYKYVIGCIFVILCISAATAKKKVPSTALPFIDEACGEQFKENRCLKLACPRKHVIFDLDVIARLYYKDNTSYCSGRTAGLMTDVAHCYWQTSCRIQFPRQRMLLGLFMDDEEPGTCPYEQPNAVAVSKMGCVKEKEIFDICRGSDAKKEAGKQGVIRSHEDYPWINVRRDNITDPCSLKINKTNKAVYVTVKYVDHVDCDVLAINGRRVNASGNFNFSTDVEVKFTKCSKQEAAGSGLQFILCFKVDNPGKKIRDVCEAISKKKRFISEAGPKTWPCKSAKGRKKKHSCCCSDIKSKTCEQHLEEAKVFETKLKKETAVKTCNQDNDYPCDCEEKKGKGKEIAEVHADIAISALYPFYLKIKQTKKAVYVTVKYVDHVDCDVLAINGRRVNASGNFNFSTDVEVKFTKCSKQEAAGSGLQFILCFKADKPGKKIRDVCEAISKKKRLISEAGPKTWPCKNAKGKKKKHSCCCSDIKSKTCKKHLKEAKVFETKLKKETAVKTCNQDNDYPCDCEGKKGNSG